MWHVDDGTLHAFLDEELQPADERRTADHLLTCAACRGRLDQERATRTRAHEILRYADPVPIAQPDFDSILARRRIPFRYPRRFVRPVAIPWAATVVVALAAGWWAQRWLPAPGMLAAHELVTFVELADGPQPSLTVRPPEEQFPDPRTGGLLARPLPPPRGIEPAPPPVVVAFEMGQPASPGMRSATRVDVTVDALEATRTAGAALGMTPAVIRGLPVLSYEAVQGEYGAIRVVQVLPDGVKIELTERRAPVGSADGVVVRLQRGLEVTLRADLPADSLRVLADRLR